VTSSDANFKTLLSNISVISDMRYISEVTSCMLPGCDLRELGEFAQLRFARRTTRARVV
jgi:hypothetical protein